MDSKQPDRSMGDTWLDNILGPQDPVQEIGPDELAVQSAGLIHPADAELEKIVSETKESDWTEKTQVVNLSGVETELPQEQFRDQEYREVFGEEDSLSQVFEPENPPAPLPQPPEEVYMDSYEDYPEPEEEEPEEEDDLPPLPKGRPAMKRGYGLLGIPHILATVVWLVLTISIGVSLGRIIWVCAADMLAFGRTEERTVSITISDTDTIDDIAQMLKAKGLIRYPGLFKVFVDIKDAEEEIGAGTFELKTIYDYNALVNSLMPYSSGRKTVEVTIPEGYSCREIFALLEAEGVCTVAELEAWAANGELADYWFLEGVTRGSKYCLEGYLFPDTYEFYLNAEPQEALEKLLDGFDYRFTDIMKEQMLVLNETISQMMLNAGHDQEYVDAHQMDLHDIIIVASMIQEESGDARDNYNISSVIYNRLTQWEYTYLNIDATVIYALGGKDGPLTESDLLIDSPYNTYVYMGLPAGPISNPGRESIFAAMDPNDTDYYYYALNPETGLHEFFETEWGFEEFLSTVDYDD